MSDVEPIVIVFLTKERTDYALRTLQSTRAKLRYPDLRWYIADGGSSDYHFDAVRAALDGEHIIGWHRDPPTSYGRDANIAWEAAHKDSNLTLWLEDDWELLQEFNLRPYADAVRDNAEVGMIRLGYIQAGMRGETRGYNGHLYWLLDRDSPDAHVFAGHPSLRHWRFREAYGPYEEGLPPGVTEISYAWQFRQGMGPGILWPCELGPYGVFGHIGERQSYTL